MNNIENSIHNSGLEKVIGKYIILILDFPPPPKSQNETITLDCKKCQLRLKQM